MKLFAHFSLYRLASVSTLIGAAFFFGVLRLFAVKLGHVQF